MAMLSIEMEPRSAKIAARIVFQDEGKSGEAASEFHFNWTTQDQEDLRWYLEDYLIYPADPAPQVAARVVRRIESAGAELFSAIFRNNTDVSKLWDSAAGHLADLRIELRTTEPRIVVLPWELMREPDSRSVLAISCHSFVRVHSRPSRPLVESAKAGPMVRVLLVICRPAGAGDVPFRSVASRLLKGLRGGLDRDFQVDVLRPPTYGQLSSVVRTAARANRPYHIVHFDGHGLMGGLVFEDPTNTQNRQIVEGQRVGQLLADANVPMLVLNACRSAFADPPAQPVQAGNMHEDIRVFGSLAHVVADQGLPCVLAMRFNVFVETAARFMLDFYSGLVAGSSVGEAVEIGRAQLSAEPLRQSVPRDVPLEDWIVPVLFEAHPLRLFSSHRARPLSAPAQEVADHGEGDLPRPPDAGFFGRDETLLALDRAFDSANVVLLHAYAGSGKTATASEFARWYLRTGGTKGPVLFSSFETKRTLAQVIDQLGRHYEPQLAAGGIQWAAIMDPGERRRQALKLSALKDVFWIWDNVEPIAGFPAGTESAWSADEQRELADFLRDASERGVKLLLTSRRDEAAWLDLLPSRVTVPPMPLWERVQLTQALARKMGRQSDDVQDWRPLLDFTQGNPLALTVLVAHALRKRMRTAADIERFVAELQSGAANLSDDPVQGRSRSLTASLNYGLEHAFKPAERRVVSLLHLFQGYVNAQIFRLMGTGLKALPEVAALSVEKIGQILDVGIELGLLERFGESQGIYRIHPAVPWFFRIAFEKEFGDRERECKRAFVIAMARASVSLSKQFSGGSSSQAAAGLIVEEANLRYALRLAVELGEWFGVMAALHGLEDIYVSIQGNTVEWRRLVQSVDPFVTDGKTSGAVSGRESAWAAVTEYKMRMARDVRNFVEAERMAKSLVDHWRQQAAPFLADDAKLAEGYEEIHNLSVMLESQANYLSEEGSSDGVPLFEEAFALSLKNNDNRQAAISAQGLGWAYREVAVIRDLSKALQWFAQALKLVPDKDEALKGKLMLMIASVFGRWFEAAFEKSDEAEASQNGGRALGAYQKALEWLPSFAHKDRAESFLNLGAIHLRAGDLETAVTMSQKALPLARQAGAINFETVALLNIASALNGQERFADAIAYAKAAEQAAAAWGPNGQGHAIDALELLASIRAAEKAAGKS